MATTSACIRFFTREGDSTCPLHRISFESMPISHARPKLSNRPSHIRNERCATEQENPVIVA
jgi:hypothetical protein